MSALLGGGGGDPWGSSQTKKLFSPCYSNIRGDLALAPQFQHSLIFLDFLEAAPDSGPPELDAFRAAGPVFGGVFRLARSPRMLL